MTDQLETHQPPARPRQQYGYPPLPPARRGPSPVLIGGLILLVVAALGVGGMYALGIGPFAPSATPTLVARPTTEPDPSDAGPSPSQTEAATSTPATASPSTTGTPPTPQPTAGAPATLPPDADPMERLLSHVPAALAPTCVTSPGTAPIVAEAACTAEDGAIEVSYLLFDSEEAMFQSYEGFRLVSGIEPSTGNCSEPLTWPAENGYTIGGQPVGRWLCTEALDATSIYWTDNRLNILSNATHTAGDYARLVRFWETESGPNL